MRRILLLVVVAWAMSACGEAPAASTGNGAEGRPLIVVTTTVLGDLVHAVAGDTANVEVLMGTGSDPHAYEPSAQEAARLREADLIVANGLGLEAGMAVALDSAEADGVRLLHVGDHVDPLEITAGEHDDDHGHGSLDPHIWMDPLRMAEAAHVVAGALADVEPDGGWTGRADAYAADMTALSQEIADTMARIPPGARKLVTSHHAFGYFAARYRFVELGAVVPSGTTLAEPSAADLERLVATVRAEDVPAIFTDATAPRRLVETLAAEAGDDVRVVELFTEALNDHPQADTYADMMRTNARRITEALTAGG